MVKAFIVSLTVFGLSLIFLIVALLVNMGFSNPLFDSQYDGSPYIEQMRAIINVFDEYDRLAAMITVISACSATITGLIAKIRGQILP